MFRFHGMAVFTVACLMALAGPGVPAAHAARGDCGQPASDRDRPTASDALLILRVAVGLDDCAFAICDVDANCSVNAVDALRLLKYAVGQAVQLSCAGACVTTTTTTTSTTTTSTTTTTIIDDPVWPEDPSAYVPGPISYLSELGISPLEQGVPTCCKDFGSISKDAILEGTDNLDNALAVLAGQLQSLGVDLNALLAESIASGSLAVLFDHQLLDLGAAATAGRGLSDQFALVQLAGIFTDGTTYAEAAAGQGRFLMRRDSFVAGSGEPVNFAYPAQMNADTMNAGPFTLDLSLPFGFLTLALPTEQAELTAAHGPVTAAGITYTDGRLSGLVRLDAVFGSINQILDAPACECLAISEPVYRENLDGAWISACVSDARARCPAAEQDVCVVLAGADLLAVPTQVCLILPGVLSGAADLDLDAQPATFEALSLGLEFTGVFGTAVGLEP